MNIKQAKQTTEELTKLLWKLKIISWDEVFGHLPDSKEIEEEVDETLRRLSNGIEDLKQFFE
ncbi:dTDP-D-glucose 4,6-dehydratase [Paenibacillus jamilae]|nr:dTDP-D-glucose 4,6-dehydratase [Paenibacillus jamilae]